MIYEFSLIICVFVVTLMVTLLFCVAARQEDFMLPDDHPAVVAELERRSNIRAKANVKDSKDTGETTIIGSKRGGGKKAKEPSGKTKGIDDTSDSGKWQLAHQQLAESRFLTDLC